MASDPSGVERLQLPKKPVQPQQSIFQQQDSSHKHTKLYHRKGHNKGFPQGSCSGPGFSNKLYNSILTLELNSKSTSIAFADDLVILTRGETVTETENFMNAALTKVQNWAHINRLEFN